MNTASRSFGKLYKEQRFLVLLALLLSYIVLSILLEGSGHQLLVRTTLLSLVLLAAFSCLQFKKGGTAASRWLVIAAFLSGWVTIVAQFPVVFVITAAFRIIFFLTVTGALIYQVATSREVTSGIIIGAVDGYLLLGVVGAAAFSIVETTSPGSFISSGSNLAQPDIVYYSFITLATVGYGDISPLAPTARSLAVLLAVSGQLYIAVLMALLVGKFVGTRQ